MENKTEKIQLKNVLVQTLTLLIVMMSFWFVFSQLKASEINILDTLLNANGYIFVAVFCVIAVTAVSPLLWQVLMRGSGAEIPLKKCYGLWWSTNIAKYIPGKVGLLASRVWVTRQWGSAVVLESFIWEIIISTSSASFAASMLFYLEGYPESTKIAIILGCLLSLLPIVSPKITQRLVRKPLKFFGKGDWVSEVTMSRKTYIIALLLMTSTWVLWGFAHKYMLIGLGYDAPLYLLIGAFAVAWFTGFVAFFLPAGFGAREGVFTYTLSYFVTGGVGAILAILSRTINIFVDILLFFVGVMVLKSTEIREEE